MNKVYPSKNDIFIFIIICLIVSLAASIKAAMESRTLLSWLITLLIVMVWMAMFLLFFPTKYIIDGDNLLICCGFQRKCRIDFVEDLKAINPNIDISKAL